MLVTITISKKVEKTYTTKHEERTKRLKHRKELQKEKKAENKIEERESGMREPNTKK